MEEKILAMIPARGGSKGVKKKNIRSFCGKPLIGWTIEEAKKSKFIDRIIVSTEDEEISAVSREFKAEVIIRPRQLARDDTPTMEAIFYTLDRLKEEGYVPDYVLLLQCTSPLRTVKHIDEAIDQFLNHNRDADSLISVTKEEHPPWWLKNIREDGYLDDFLEYDKMKYARRQDFSTVYKLNGAIYIIKTQTLFKYKSFETSKTIPYIMDSYSSIDIDSEFDFILAENTINIVRSEDGV